MKITAESTFRTYKMEQQSGVEFKCVILSSQNVCLRSTCKKFYRKHFLFPKNYNSLSASDIFLYDDQFGAGFLSSISRNKFIRGVIIPRIFLNFFKKNG